MDYISARDAALSWGITQRRVAILCADGRIDGAEMLGNMWLIPKNAKKPVDGRTLRYSEDTRVKPFLKWVGGKGQLIDEIRKKYPNELGKRINKYAEPFVGGGAVLFDILSNYNLDEIYISDSNSELINAYKIIEKNVEELVDVLSEYQSEYVPLEIEDRKEYYYNKRNRFNELKLSNVLSTELAALIIFINRTCFNGLYRVNSKGAYNVPMGSYLNPCICDESNLRRISERLKNVNIICGDYRESSDFIDENTFVYFDPPYRPLTESSSFTAYTKDSFDDNDQINLANYIKELSDKGAYIVVSNSDPKNINKKDDFFDDLYSDFNISRVYASRAINSKGGSRGKISELLISNY